MSSDAKRPGRHWNCTASQAPENLQRAIATFLPYASERLGWTRAIFVGDSISELVFMELQYQMTSRHGNPVLTTLFHKRNNSCGRAVCSESSCSEWFVSARNHSFAACYFSAGRYEGATRVNLPLTASSCDAVRSFDGVNIGDAIECMFQLNKLQITDRIVLNTGLHHRLSGANLTIPSNVLAVPWWRRGRGQCLVWRETLPQHFPNTRTGAFNPLWVGPNVHHIASRNASLTNSLQVSMACDPSMPNQCAPIPPAVLGFDQGYNEPANAALLKVARDQGGRVQVARAYKPLLMMYDDHPGCSGSGNLDCSHFPVHSTALAVAACITLRQLAACHVPTLPTPAVPTTAPDGISRGSGFRVSDFARVLGFGLRILRRFGVWLSSFVGFGSRIFMQI